MDLAGSAILVALGVFMVIASIWLASGALAPTLAVLGGGTVVLGVFSYRLNGPIELGPDGLKATVGAATIERARDAGLAPQDVRQAYENALGLIDAALGPPAEAPPLRLFAAEAAPSPPAAPIVSPSRVPRNYWSTIVVPIADQAVREVKALPYDWYRADERRDLENDLEELGIPPEPTSSDRSPGEIMRVIDMGLAGQSSEVMPRLQGQALLFYRPSGEKLDYEVPASRLWRAEEQLVTAEEIQGGIRAARARLASAE